MATNWKDEEKASSEASPQYTIPTTSPHSNNIGSMSISASEAEMYNNDNMKGSKNKNKSNNKLTKILSWKCCCITYTCIQLLTLIIFLIVLFTSTLPNFAQTTIDGAQMDIISGSIYNPTNTSITLNSTIMVSNAGMFDGVLNSFTATVTYQDKEIGKMTMPTINTLAGQNTIVTVITVLEISNVEQFQASVRSMLAQNDQIWHLSASAVNVEVNAFGTHNFEVDINKDLVLSGCSLYNFIASDLTVNDATNSTISTSANMQFISDSTFTFVLPQSLLQVYYEGVYIGYTELNGVEMYPGLNILSNQSLVIESYPENNNREVLNDFFGGYMAGNDQMVTLKGPIANNVLNGILELNVTSQGYNGPAITFGGLITKTTLDGWDDGDGNTVRGAYSNMLNPLNVPIRITSFTGVGYIPDPFSYSARLAILYTEDCPATRTYAYLRIGKGMYKQDSSKTYVDIDANSRGTFYTLVDPPSGYDNGVFGGCMNLGIFPFDCCFATMTTAYVCQQNPQLESDADGQLDNSYIPLEVEANITIMINYEFQVDVQVTEDFFPVFFGYEVYNYGGIVDLVTCSNIDID